MELTVAALRNAERFTALFTKKSAIAKSAATEVSAKGLFRGRSTKRLSDQRRSTRSLSVRRLPTRGPSTKRVPTKQPPIKETPAGQPRLAKSDVRTPLTSGWHLIALLAWTCTLAGCDARPQTRAITEITPEQGYRFSQLAKGEKNTDELFVIVAFSGGGKRASALSYGVLEKLRQTPIQWRGQQKTLLDEVDVISSVSGGSFTAAYYALHREAIFDGSFERFLKQDTPKALLHETLTPSNWPSLASADYGRSDLASNYYDDTLYGGATFATLTEAALRPMILINATDMSSGSQFTFTQDYLDLMCVDLGAIKLARAVASSSAFPGAFTPMTYSNHADRCQHRSPKWWSQAESRRRTNPDLAEHVEELHSYTATENDVLKRPFVHLIDGGVADNLGLRNLLFALETKGSANAIRTLIDERKIRKLLILVVNAANNPPNERDQTASIPGLGDLLTQTATIPLNNFTRDTLERIDNYVDTARQPGEDNSGLDVYLTEVSFDHLMDAEARSYFDTIPTSFGIAPEAVDELMQVAGQLLDTDGNWQRLLAQLQAETRSGETAVSD
ncbi:hypothetical protein FKG94_23530 [Exilibacterium tricleocarpae]|uniref:PNPLA domain-containing protein n=1 Tax=Exilibacterium tricleocarpae TaxID=2591008 RepID=A0A545STH1_9GAMM|nr:patatin-like phospholipase family protein [Exilibacterium tricleocarpae]TQV68267.1 hypothetical protein FKG94_23530 [Exilibacterium tricleocarpae]